MKVSRVWTRSRTRPSGLELCAMLAEVDEGEFAALRDALDVNDSVS